MTDDMNHWHICYTCGNKYACDFPEPKWDCRLERIACICYGCKEKGKKELRILQPDIGGEAG